MSRPGQQPVSYRTVPGRHRTQKWQAATKQNYDGDDWGDYDPYDEYGGNYVEEQPPLPQQLPPHQQQQQQQQQPPPPPHQQYGSRPSHRTNSFDRGDDGRMFATAAPSAGPFPPYDPRGAAPSAPIHPSLSNDDLRSKTHMRDFTDPEHVPAPLMTRASPAPAEWFPPRKSSLTGGSSADTHITAAAEAVAAKSLMPSTSETAPASTSAEKPLPFIRPSDIYKRIPEERERERRSEESSRPSMDSLQREVEPSGQPGLTAGPRTNLATVAESRESRLFMDEPGSGLTVGDKSSQASPLASSQGTADLHHQPSQGLRSAVQQAWDRADEGSLLTRDGSQSNSDSMSRSNTTSTSAISPITSRAPFPAVAQQVVPIVEEDQTVAQPVHRQPPTSDFEPGYRKSLVTPGTEQSPARTPTLEDADKRLSSSMVAETADAADPPDVPDQAAEIPEATVETTETPAVFPSHTTASPFPIVGRGRSGTDYSIREADLANTVNASPPDRDGLAETVAEAKAEQVLFLSTHAGTPITPASTNPSLGGFRTGTPTNAAPSSPSKGRVREIADQYQDIHNASRRNSEASINSIKSRKAGDPVDSSTLAPNARPGVDREQSFQPQLPGGWISPAPTPSAERPEEETVEDFEHLAPPTPRAEGSIDLTPTTKKVPLQEVTSSTSATTTQEAPLDALKNAGDQLGAALLASMGLGHQTRDFASSQPAEPVQQPDKHPSSKSGLISSQPPLLREDTGSSAAPTSAASSVPPTPLAKDIPNSGLADSTSPDRLTDNYFTSTVAPLRISSRQSSAEPLGRVAEPARPPAANTLSIVPVSDDTESDRLRKEIVRSLENTEAALNDDAQRIQEALDASENERGVEQDHFPHAAAEISRPGLLSQRFSWETTEPVARTSNEPVSTPAPVIAKTPEPESPEIKPERAYERPRSSVLHVMNADSDAESPAESIPELRIPEATEPIANPPSTTVSDTPAVANGLQPFAVHVTDETQLQSPGDHAPTSLSDRAVSVDSGPRLPSYYLGNDQLDLSLDPPEKDSTTSASMSQPTTDIPAKTKAAPIPPFRNILAIKSSEERIRSFDQTRQTFADMNTGLSDWLATMIEDHPEHADVVSGKPFSLQTSGTFKRGHKPSPSMLKFTKQFGDTQRAVSGSSAADSGTTTAQRRSSLPGNDRLDMDKVSQRGKDLMKSAGMLGGKTKGLFAKGKSKFGIRRDSDKALFPPSTTSAAVFSSPLPPPDLPTSTNYSSLRGGAATPPPPPDASSSPSSQPDDTYLSLQPAPSHASHSRTSSASHDTSSSSRPFTNLSSIFRTVSRTKSKSKSPNPSRSRLNPDSRPNSLVLPRPDPSLLRQGISISSPVDEADFRRPESASTSGGGDGIQANTMLSPFSKSRREAWEETEQDATNGSPDEGQSRGRSDSTTANSKGAGEGGLRIPAISGLTSLDNVNDNNNLDSFENRKLHLERLGVLPSPVETTFEFGLPGTSPTSIRRSRDAGDAGDVTLSPSPIAIKGNRARTGSDLAMLPSQIRRKSVPSASAPERISNSDGKAKVDGGVKRAQVIGEEEEADIEDFVFEASPITVKPMQPTLVTTAGKMGEEDEEDLYGATPITPKVPSALREGIRTKDNASGIENAVVDAQKAVQGREHHETAGKGSEGSETAEPATQQSESVPPGPKPDSDVNPRQVSRNEDETRSEISAEEEATPVEPARRDSAVSRRSSVSSLGAPDLANIATVGFPPENHDDAEGQIVMSAQAVPAGPIGPSVPATPATPTTSGQSPQVAARPSGPFRLTSSEALDYRERFANRTYHRDPEAERPLSYVPLPRDSTGAPVQETLSSREQPAVGLSRSTRRSSGTPRYKPHPAVRGMGVQPTEYERLRTSVPQPIEPDIAHQAQSNEVAKSKKPRNFPALLPRKNRQSGHDTPPAPKPGPSVEPEPSVPEPLSRLPQEQQQGRRRSVVMEVLFNRRPSLAERGGLSQATSIADLPSAANSVSQGEAMAENNVADQFTPRPVTLKKPQRSTSTASTQGAEPKKKNRFSMGMLFGRSSTTGHATAKPARLSKMPPPVKESTPRQSGQSAGDSDNTVMGRVRGYEAYEALRKQNQEVPAFQENASRLMMSQQAARPPSSRREPRLPNLGTMPEDSAMPPLGDVSWYRPDSPPPREPMSAPADPRSSYPRRVSSTGNRGEQSFSEIPEAFRPTQASFSGPVQPIGPPPILQSPHRADFPNPRAGSARMARYYGGPSPPPTGDPRRQRQHSYGSDVSQLSRQVSGGTDPRDASISPVHSRNVYEGYAIPSGNRSIGREFAPSPPGDPANASSPWGPGRPRESDEPQRALRGFSGPPAQWYPRSNERPLSPEETSSLRGPYRPPGPQMYDPPSQSPPHGGFPYSPDSAGFLHRQPLPAPQTSRMRNFHPDSAAYSSPPHHTTSHSQTPHPFQDPTNLPPAIRSPVSQHQTPYTHGGGPPDQVPRHSYRRPDFPSVPPPSGASTEARQQRRRSQDYDAGEAAAAQTPLPRGYPQGFRREGPQQQLSLHERQLYDRQVYERQQMQQLQQQQQQQQRHRRRTSAASYTGRRDDPAVGEEELQMRGASYPGQEWTPVGIGEWD